MKKTLAIVLVCLMTLTMLAACGDDTAPEASSAQSGDLSGGNDAPVQDNAPAQDDTPADPPADPPPADDFDTDRVIAVFTREDGSGTRDAFVNITGVGDDMYIEAAVQNATNQITTSVETNATAIGYVSVGSLSSAVKALSIDGVLPSDATIIDGTYSLQRPFLVCVTDESKNNPLVQDFLDFMLSVEGQELSSSSWTQVVGSPLPYSSADMSGTLKVGGSTSVEPLIQKMREAYIALNPDVEIEISGGGSGTGINEATEGIIDIGLSSRELRDNEKEALTDIAIALDGVAIIVNIANPLNELSMETVREIFTGEKTRWNQVG